MQQVFDQRKGKDKKLKANLLENALHSLPANEPKPTPPPSAGTIVAAGAINHMVNIKLKRIPRDFPMSYWCPYTAGLLHGSVATRDCWLLRQKFTMSERDHGATDGLHLGDAGGEEKRVMRSESRKVEVFI